MLGGHSNAFPAHASDCCYTLHFPKFVRQETGTSSGRVSKLEVTVQCGRIAGVVNIPKGWSVTVSNPSANIAQIHAEADHGASYLWDMKAWNDSVLIMPTDSDCFNVGAEIFTDGPEENPNPVIRLARKQLTLLKSAR